MMTLSRICRFLITIAAALFAAAACTIWAAPDAAARRFGLEAVSTAGRATLSADLGGLFAGLAVLLATAAVRRETQWCVAAAVLPLTIAGGRLIGWWASGRTGLNLAALALELGVALVVGLIYRPAASPRAAHGVSRCESTCGVRR